MSITKDANYAKMNYKNSESTYENLTPTALANKVNYNQNDLYYAPLAPFGGYIFRNNIGSENITDAITEIENRVAQCGRKFDELEFGAGKDIDLLDGAGHQITLDTYYIGNIVYLPMTQKYYMLLYSFTYSRSVLLQSDDGLSWNINSESTNIICIDMKCNSRHLCFIGYDNEYSKGLYFTRFDGTTNIFNNIVPVGDFGVVLSMPSNQYDLGQYFCMSFDMDENSLLCISLDNPNSQPTFGIWHVFHFNCNGYVHDFDERTTFGTTSGFPKILNINPGQYIYYMKGSKFQSQLISLTKDNKLSWQSFPISNIYDVLLINEFGCTTAYNNIYVRTDNSTNTNSTLQNIYINSPNDITLGLSPSVKYAPPLLLAKRCCSNYIYFYRLAGVAGVWGYNNSFEFSLKKPVNDSNNDNIGINYIIETGFNPSFINKINDKLFIYENNEVNSTTLNNSKLYISQIKI